MKRRTHKWTIQEHELVYFLYSKLKSDGYIIPGKKWWSAALYRKQIKHATEILHETNKQLKPYTIYCKLNEYDTIDCIAKGITIPGRKWDYASNSYKIYNKWKYLSESA